MKKAILILAGLSFLGLAACSELATVVKCGAKDFTSKPCN